MLLTRTPSRRLTQLGLVMAVALPAGAQSIPGAVLAKREPHHHLAYEDSTIRVLRVRVPPHDTTLLHEHDPDYFWIALGPSTLINVRPGSPDANVSSADLAFHYAVGNFAHIARNPGDAPFDNITVELLEPQADVRNLCEAAVAGQPLDCPPSSRADQFFSGATEHRALATAHLRVSLLTIPAGGTLRSNGGGNPTWVIALDTADTKRALALEGGPHWVGGTFRDANEKWAVKNESRTEIRVIGIVKN